VEDGVRLAVEGVVLDLRTARKNTRTAEKNLAQARENRRINKLRYDQQIATATDVLNAQIDLTWSNTNYYRALYGESQPWRSWSRQWGVRSFDLILSGISHR
jgi:outer membrane protein TolC